MCFNMKCLNVMANDNQYRNINKAKAVGILLNF